MCDCCNMVLGECNEYKIYKPLPLRDEHTKKRIKSDGNHPEMYLREYNTDGANIWGLICEFADDNGTVVESPIIYCPRCGDKLVGRNKR